MKMIKAIIRPERFDFVKKALEDKGCYGMTVAEVRGRGSQKGIAIKYRRSTMVVDLLPKISIEVVVNDANADMVIDTIAKAAKTGKIGDGRIFVMPVERAIRIRTDEVDT
jgi:nitrogen regulatory protein P-II 1